MFEGRLLTVLPQENFRGADNQQFTPKKCYKIDFFDGLINF